MVAQGIVLLGASRAGVSVSSALQNDDLLLRGIWNRSKFELPGLPSELADWRPGSSGMPHARLYLIAVSDDAIAEIAEWLGQTEAPGPESIVCHLSGAMGPSVLSPACIGGAKALAIHPLRSFADHQTESNGLNGVYCGLESDDPKTEEWAEGVLTNVGAQVFEFPARHRDRYHMAATASCNFLVTLFDLASRHLVASGMDEAIARPALLDLMERTLTNIGRKGSAAALTGPVVRGDSDVVRGHLDLLSDAPLDRSVYLALAEATVQLGRRDGRPDEEAATRVLDLLRGDDSCPS
jgi:predicted short-subunit dehydrogenase-like oxidoreductase (DUF2520 family)